MTAPSILVVEDKPGVRQMIRFALCSEGYLIEEAADVEEALACISKSIPSLVLLDWMMPDRSGYDMLKQLHGNPEWQNIPVIMLTAKDEESDKVSALEHGADDYMTKPFSPRELNARIKAVLRRVSPHTSEEEVAFGPFLLKPDEGVLVINNKEVPISLTEFRLLHFFVSHSGRVYSRTQILNNVWGVNKFLEERTVDVHIRRLRKILAAHNLASAIETIRGLGYRMQNLSSACYK